MDLIEQKISSLIESQFPLFYKQEGPTFVAFVKAYYEWMEQEGNALYKSRRILKYRDIDDTLDEFLIHFQKKYLYGIPFNVIINKRFLLKHVLDVYRSKGSVQAYKLLFRLIYNEDVDVYLPGMDMLRVSDGTWVEPKYLEVSNNGKLQELVGKKIVGLTSRTTAVVESYVSEPINENVVSSLYISNIAPTQGEFVVGEKIIVKDDLNSSNLVNIVNEAASVVGSLNYIEIENGGNEFKVGDVLKIVQRDLNTNKIISSGVDGLVKVASTFRGRGNIRFNINRGGSGYLANAVVLINKSLTDITGNGATFSIGSLSNVVEYTYNTDLLIDYANLALNAVSYGFPLNTSANSQSVFSTYMSFKTDLFGSIASLTNFNSGLDYTDQVNIDVRTVMVSKVLQGNVTYSNSSFVITGVGTQFSSAFTSNSMIYLQANNFANTGEYLVINSVSNNTHMTLKYLPKFNSGATSTHRIAPVILQSNFASYEPGMSDQEGRISGRDADITGIPAQGNSVILSTKIVNSGKGYNENEFVKLYLYGAIQKPLILDGGLGYSNGDILIFSGDAKKQAEGIVITNSNGSIVNTSIQYVGSGYQTNPTVFVKSETGNGAVLRVNIDEFNTIYEVTGRVKKKGIGRGKGYWSTTRGFLNSDKYIQDSYFYQDFSYQLKAATALAKYKDILYNTFHIAGTELFGEFRQTAIQSMPLSAVTETVTSPTAGQPIGLLLTLTKN